MPRPWYIPSNYNTNYYANSCATDVTFGVPSNSLGYQYTKTGNGYAGIGAYQNPFNNWRSYIQVKLKDSLQTGKCYHCFFWVSLADLSSYATNNIAMWLSKEAKYSDTITNPLGLAVIPANPQAYNYGNPVVKDTQNWVKISSVYLAQGGEQFITIGNFKNNANTIAIQHNSTLSNQTFYYVDDVYVIPLDSLPLKADAGPDTTIAPGDSVFIGSLTNGIANITWYNAAGQVINTIAPGFYVTPTSNTFYVLQQTVCGYTSRDTVYVTVNPLPLRLLTFTARVVSSSLSLGEGRGEVLLNWTTTREINVDHFEIQRSANSRNFYAIGNMQAGKTIYSFTDNNPFATPLSNSVGEGSGVWYRLRMVDKDRRFTYSPVRMVENNSKPALTIYPNPANGFVNIEYSKIMQVVIMDITGKPVANYTCKNANAVTLNIKELPEGFYILKVTGNDGEQSQKLIKTMIN